VIAEEKLTRRYPWICERVVAPGGAHVTRPRGSSFYGIPAIDTGFSTVQVKAEFSIGLRNSVAKPDLGIKRLCANCGAKFYDLGKTPIVCPKCDTVFEPVVSSRARADSARAAAKAPAEAEVPEKEDAELVPLEEADAETHGKKAKATADVDVDDDDDIEIEDDDDDNTFIEDEEEGDDDVTDIIGERDQEEET
jgi:uncharacterized protein (TIGR02300 family)